MFGIVASYHRMQFQGKLMIQTQENGEKPHFGPDLGSLAQIPPISFVGFTSTSNQTLFQAIILCNLMEN